jgi:A/G-specific adenine glycosylase
MRLGQKQVLQFQDMIYDHYRQCGRVFPWRSTTDPYAILVSEVMSQQTQITRVVPKYTAWMKRWPTIADLDQASLAQVLTMWSGLGYNRRAKSLLETSKVVVRHFEGILPREEKALLALPGIGRYTAAAIQAFAFNLPVVVMDTNIRTVYIATFFPKAKQVTDSELYPIIETTMDRLQPGRWFNALIDYGASMKSQGGNHATRSKSYVKQAPLKGSVREVRGYVLKQVTQGMILKRTDILNIFDEARLTKALTDLRQEGLIKITPDGESVTAP